MKLSQIYQEAKRLRGGLGSGDIAKPNFTTGQFGDSLSFPDDRTDADHDADHEAELDELIQKALSGDRDSQESVLDVAEQAWSFQDWETALFEKYKIPYKSPDFGANRGLWKNWCSKCKTPIRTIKPNRNVDQCEECQGTKSTKKKPFRRKASGNRGKWGRGGVEKVTRDTLRIAHGDDLFTSASPGGRMPSS